MAKRIQNAAAMHLIVHAIVCLREEQGLSQEDVAMRSGLQRANLAMIESGASNCTIPNLYAIARALGVEARELLPSMADVASIRVVSIAGRALPLTKSDIDCLRQQLADAEEGE